MNQTFSLLFFLLFLHSPIYRPLHKALKDHFKSFTTAPEEQYDALCKKFKTKSVKKGDFLLLKGDICDFEAFIVKGLFKIFLIDKDNNERILVFSSENWWVTDFDSFDRQTPSQMNIQALEDSEILYINRADKEQSLLDNDLIYKIEKVTVKRAHLNLRGRLFDSISKTAEECYLEFIEEYPDLWQRLTNIQIASYLGVTPEFISIIRRKITDGRV